MTEWTKMVQIYGMKPVKDRLNVCYKGISVIQRLSCLTVIFRPSSLRTSIKTSYIHFWLQLEYAKCLDLFAVEISKD
jgi:hypothetical protein